MIRFDSVTKRYPDGTTAVDDLSFEVGAGELVTLVGPSGCGKTTTMMMVNRLIDPTHGRIYVDGSDVAGVDPSNCAAASAMSSSRPVSSRIAPSSTTPRPCPF